MEWTIWWDTKRPPADRRWSTAVAQTEVGALERAAHFLKLGFIVYAIRNPDGEVVMDEAQLVERFGKALPDGASSPRGGSPWR